jgi:hypothetical protein
VKSLKQGKSLAQKRRRLIKKDGQDVGQESKIEQFIIPCNKAGWLLARNSYQFGCAYYNDGR